MIRNSMFSIRFAFRRLFIITVGGVLLNAISSGAFAVAMHANGSLDAITRIDVRVFYYLPRDRQPLEDWRERIEYLMRRAQKFHHREFAEQSRFEYTIYAKPFIASATSAGLPKDDANRFYWRIMNEVWESNVVSFTPDYFPILLVFSDCNFSSGYDDWKRECTGETCQYPEPHSDCSGYVNPNGEDRPGTRCGGARAVYWPEKHIGLGLVTADGWKVPLLGSDCVVYHEGIGHSIGLPHPEPINNSVMGLAQYVDGIQKTWIDVDQKKSLGWISTPVDRDNLFSSFSISHFPLRPSATDTVHITASFPLKLIPSKLDAEFQTDLQQPFQKIGPRVMWNDKDWMYVSWAIDPIPIGQSIAYRIHIETTTGEQEEMWSYYKIR